MSDTKRSSHTENLLDMVAEIDTCGENLTSWEITFIASMIDNPPQSLSAEQENTIKRIYKDRMP